MKYLIGGFVVLVLVLALAGVVYQAIATARDLEKYSPPGKLVDVGGYQLHLNCQGEGSPTVVMDYGLGGMSLVWSWIQPEIASLTRVCTYDRAGYGWSDPSPHPRTSQQMVQELYGLLKNSGIEAPYLLVGHSLGGLNLRLFASQYPNEVAGLILVDAVPANVYSRLPAFQKSMANTQRLFSTLSVISRIGLLRLLIQLRGTEVAPDFVKQLPLEIQPIILAKFLPQTFDTAIAENQLMATSAEQVSQTELPNDLPLVVLSHGVNMFDDLPQEQAKQAELTWQELQAEIANLSSNSDLKIAEQSGHNIHIDQPQLVVNTIRQAIDRFRQT
ncbi:MAG: alpha/beta hydrolase [Cyanobacteria bacterium CRU_2_1]|nr:alpha/beta hydrolase [Cyanobacteria bacterium CRU_2_1]